MGVKAYTWAWEQPTEDRFLLVALADIADDKRDFTCFPSIATLAEMIRRSPDTVRRGLQRLETDGYIERQQRHRRNGSRTSDIYRLKVVVEVDRGSGPSQNAGRGPRNLQGGTPAPMQGGPSHSYATPITTTEPPQEEEKESPKPPKGASSETLPAEKDFDGPYLRENGMLVLGGRLERYWLPKVINGEWLELVAMQFSPRPRTRLPLEDQVMRFIERRNQKRIERTERYLAACERNEDRRRRDDRYYGRSDM